MTLNEMLLTVGLISFIVYAVVNILYLIDLKKTSTSVRHFIAKTEQNLHPALFELRATLADFRKVAGDVSAVTEKTRSAVDLIASLEKNIEHLYVSYRENFGQSAQANMAGIKAGVKAGFASLIKNLKDKKEGSA